jgi:hypothetical protein
LLDLAAKWLDLAGNDARPQCRGLRLRR